MLKEWAGNSGIIVVNKPKGMSSRTAVDHVQGWFAEKIPTGHAGTLDPLATGVLVNKIAAVESLLVIRLDFLRTPFGK